MTTINRDYPDGKAITVKGVKKVFKLPHEYNNSLKNRLINFKKRGYETQVALKDISFNVKKGEFFGIVGRNGSGKSTLLKILAGIYTADEGSVEIDGNLTPFIELGVGFNHQLSGRDNVFLNGALLGFTRKEMEIMYDDIVEFAELGNFMDQKLKNYSSGMQVRLAFSIAIRTSTDILILDEVLAVGDASFQQKCFDYFMNLKQEKKTVVLVTHDMGAVRQYCDRAVMIEGGLITEEGSPEKVAAAYQKLFIDEVDLQSTRDNVQDGHWGTGEITVKDTSSTVSERSVIISTSYIAHVDIENPVLGISIYSPSGQGLVDANTYQSKKRTGSIKKGQIIYVTWEIPNIFVKGKYRISTGCTDSSMRRTLDQVAHSGSFRVNRDTPTGGIVFPQVKIKNFKYSKSTQRTEVLNG
jgi:ABC-2 type transport system ATP-binding protein